MVLATGMTDGMEASYARLERTVAWPFVSSLRSSLRDRVSPRAMPSPVAERAQRDEAPAEML